MQNNTKHIVRLAQQQSLASFSDLVVAMLADTDALIASALRSAPPVEQTALNAARYWLSDSAQPFRSAILVKFRGFLERAMETMHTDLRTGLRDIRAANLSLVEDDVMTRQVELDRLVLRLRDVDQLSLGKINLTIANLHGVSKVSERENPFRPYLAARALYETLREMVSDSAVSKVLFDHMAGAMASQLPAYYAAILGHFEARGVDARLLAQPSAMTRADRERVQAQFGAMSALQVHELQELVWQVLDERGTARVPVSSETAPAPHRPQLDDALRLLQQTPDEAPAPLALSQRFGAQADAPDRLTIDLVSMVFDFVARDTHMDAGVRAQLTRLHVPFLRAAVLEPQVLHAPHHPARSLFDRIGTLAAGMPVHAGAREAITADSARVAGTVLTTFERNCAVFANAEADLDRAVGTALRASAPACAALADAVDQTDTGNARQAALDTALAAVLTPLRLDPRVNAFIRQVWVQVMLRQTGSGSDAGLLPELVWSAQEKATPADRAQLVRTLPDLVRRIREGVETLGLPAADAKAALDQLVAVHMDVLGQRMAPGGLSTSLDWLRVHFAAFSAAGVPAAGEPVPAAVLADAFKARGLAALLHADPAVRAAQPADAPWLAQARPGASYEALVDGKFCAVRLHAVSAGQSAYVFSGPANDSTPLVFRQAALLAALDAGTVRPLEYAPLFERAVTAVMAGLGAQAARA